MDGHDKASPATTYYWGESRRLTIRFSDRDIRDLDQLVELWDLDRSAVMRKVLRQVVVEVRQPRREAMLCALPEMNVTELRTLARRLRVRGRSRMTAQELRHAVRCAVQGRDFDYRVGGNAGVHGLRIIRLVQERPVLGERIH